MKSQLAIHLLAANLASGSMLSRMRAYFASPADLPTMLAPAEPVLRVLDNIESTSPIMAAVE
jgi:hypothetical protein